MPALREVEQHVKVIIDEDQYIADGLTGELKTVQARIRALRAQEKALIDERLVHLRRVNLRRRERQEAERVAAETKAAVFAPQQCDRPGFGVGGFT